MTRLPPRLKPLWPYAKSAYTVLTRTMAPVRIRIDAHRRGWLPRAIATSTSAALATGGNGVAHHVADGAVVQRYEPAGLPDHLETLHAQTRGVFRPQVVLELPHGRVLGPHRALITRDGTLLHDEVRYFGTTRGSEHPLFLRRRVDPPTEIAGDIVVLASRGDSNYYHFLHDVVPRLSVLERWGSVVPPDRFYVPTSASFQRELLAMLGIAADRVVDADASPHIRADRLVVPTVPDLDLNHPAWAVDFLRDRLLGQGLHLPGRRIYVTRGHAHHTRIVRNEDEVLEALARYDFAVVDPGVLSVAEQIRTFAEADTIVAPHGAALANLAFASSSAAVLELFAPDFVQGCYWKLASCIPGLTYRYLVGVGHSFARRDGQGVASDIHVDIGSLDMMVGGLVDRERHWLG